MTKLEMFDTKCVIFMCAETHSLKIIPHVPKTTDSDFLLIPSLWLFVPSFC